MIRYLYIEQNRSRYRIAKMAQWLQVSKSGYYAWRKRSKSLRSTENEALLKEIIQIHEASHGAYGGRKITHEINRKSEKPVSHKRAGRIMRENGIRSKSHKKYKAATSSKHNLPVAENILNRDFTAGRPGQKMVSDITYIPTDEGWLYPAGVMDLCGDKIAGISMGGRMTKELVMSALKDAVCHTKAAEGCILHSDRGSQYCSEDYQALAKEHGFIISMSRKGNCWDNAPMESFWGEVKAGMAQRAAFPDKGGSQSRSVRVYRDIL